MNDKNLALMDRIMGEITQADEWNEIQMTDPQITDADTRWHGAMEQVKDLIPEGLYDELFDTHLEEIAATGSAGILFGIHVAEVIRDVAARPIDLSRYVQNRIANRGKSL